MKNFVILSYGSEKEYRRAIFSILSLSFWTNQYSDKVKVILYTDHPDFFFPYFTSISIVYIKLSTEGLDDMVGKTGFIHRRKVAVIDLTFKTYPGEDLIFIDSDTFFISVPSILMRDFRKGESYMHVREFTIQESLAIFASYHMIEYPRAFIKYISETEFLINGTVEKFNPEDYSWNSGLLGLSADFAGYMQDVFKLTDLFYSNSKWFISEQLAFSFLLQRKTTIRSANKYLLHYWGKRQRELIDRLLIQLLNETTPQQLNNKSFIRNITKKWRNKVIADMLLEQIFSSLLNRSWYFGFKKIVQLVLNNPRNLVQLFSTLKSVYNAKN